MAASWMETAYCRCFQAVIKAANYFLGYRMPQCLEGPGKIRELGSFLAEKGIQDILVVTGSGMVRRGQVQPLLDGFDANGIREEGIPQMIAWAKKEANPLYPVPVVWGDEDFKKLIRSLQI